MSERLDRLRRWLDERELDRRPLALLALLFLVFLGAGVGTFAFVDDGPGDGTPTPTPVELTPVSPTPTETPGATVTTVDANPSPGGTSTVTDTETATPPEAGDSPTRSPTDADPSTDEDRDENRGADPRRPALRATGGVVLVQLSELAPGEDGRGSVAFENAGDGPGRLGVGDVSLEDRENGLMDAERALGDDATTGELSGAVRVRLSVEYADGTSEYLFGTGSDFVPLASLDGGSATGSEALAAGERARVVLEWKLPGSTGNEVQSDGVSFDLAFVLESTAG